MMRKIIFLAAVAAILCSCNKERFFPDKMEPVEIEIVRFDSVILSLPTDSAGLREGLERVQQEDPYAFAAFTDNVVGVDYEDLDGVAAELGLFLNDTVYGFKAVNQKAKEEFEDISYLKSCLNNAFTRTHYLYPEWELPTLYFMITGFQGNAFMLESTDFLIGVDMYLGSDFPYYNGVVYDYQKKMMNKDCIVGHVVMNYLYYHLTYAPKQDRLLDRIIYQGKIHYMMHQLMPGRKPSYIIGWTDAEWAWCEKHEKQIWGVICDKQDLFSTVPMTVNSYVNDGPFTSEISQESPSKVGIWIGWQIIESYMKKHPETTIQQLMEMEDAQIILQESKYKP